MLKKLDINTYDEHILIQILTCKLFENIFAAAGFVKADACL